MNNTMNKKLLTVAIAQALMCAAGSLNAATITVDTNLDTAAIDGNCELREAIESANTDAAVDACTAGSGDDDIVFDNSLSGSTITLGGAELTIISNLSIDGDLDSDSSPDITIDANASSGVIKIDTGGDTVNLNGLTIQNGNAAWRGGGVYAAYPATVQLTISNTVITSNTATSKGGGLFFYDGTLSVSNSTISNNTAPKGGGVNFYAGTVNISNSTLSGNSATNSRGGGIYSYYGNLTLSNSTLSGNSAILGGSAVYAYYYGSLTINNATIVENTNTSSNGAIDTAAPIAFILTNSILANNNNGDCTGANVTSESNNLVTDGGSACGITPVSTADPELGALADNGGVTQTQLPAATSPVIDAGDNTNCGTGLTVETDQRGVSRNDGQCDIGAIESGSSSVQWQNASATVNEADGSINLILTRSGIALNAISVDYSTSINSATSPDDFTASTNTINFAAGVTSQTVIIDITDDTQTEPDETFGVTLSNTQIVSGADSILLGTNTVSSVTITDDDSASDNNSESDSRSSGGASSLLMFLMPLIMWFRRKR